MNFNITEHYARGEERPIAEFSEINEARLFLTKKTSVVDEMCKKVIYRLYDDQELMHEYNKENISVTHATYSEGTSDFNNAAPFIFQVMIKTMDSLEKKIVAQFDEEHDAHLFIACKFEDDNTVHDDDLFFIVKDGVLLDIVNKTINSNRKNASSGTCCNEEESTYKLSPLSTRPTPGGGPADFWVKKDDGDEI